MKHTSKIILISGTVLSAALWLLSRPDVVSSVPQAANDPWGRFRLPYSCSVQSGTGIKVALGSNISSETARVGDAWYGTVTEFVMSQNEDVITPGSEVGGLITGVAHADRGSLAMLELGVRSIRVNGHDESIAASADPVVAGSSRARSVGAIDARTAAVDAVATSNGHQFVLSDGAVMSFTVNETVVMR
jgi:hypothetical protein